MLEAELSPCFPTNFKYYGTPDILNPDDKPGVTPSKGHSSVLSFNTPHPHPHPLSHRGVVPMAARCYRQPERQLFIFTEESALWV